MSQYSLLRYGHPLPLRTTVGFPLRTRRRTTCACEASSQDPILSALSDMKALLKKEVGSMRRDIGRVQQDVQGVQQDVQRGFSRVEKKLASCMESQVRTEAAKAFGEQYVKPFLARSIMDLMDLVPEESYLPLQPKVFESTAGAAGSALRDSDFFMQDLEPDQWGSTSPIYHKLQACKKIAELLVDKEVVPTLFEVVASYLAQEGWVDPGVEDPARIGRAIQFCSSASSITKKDGRRFVSALNLIKHYMALGDREAKVKDMCLCRGAGILALVAFSLDYSLCGEPALTTQLEFDMRGVCSVHSLKEKVSAIIDTGNRSLPRNYCSNYGNNHRFSCTQKCLGMLSFL